MLLACDDAITGWGTDSSGIFKGFLYSEGTYTTILPPSYDWSQAKGINASGTVVGTCGKGAWGQGQYTAFLYSGGTYTILQLPGAEGAMAYDINDNGTIVGEFYNYDLNLVGGFLAEPSPVPLPPALWLLGSGLIAVVGIRKKKLKTQTLLCQIRQ